MPWKASAPPAPYETMPIPDHMRQSLALSVISRRTSKDIKVFRPPRQKNGSCLIGVPKYYNILFYCVMLSKTQERPAVATILAIYRERSDDDLLRVREPRSHVAEKWTELEWQALWYSGAFGTTFRSTDGALVEIIQFGFWNREPGPDFVHVAIRIDGDRTCEGDVEWDMHAADWERHGHSQNSAFDKVVLHVFLHSGGASHFARTTENREVIQIHLQKDVDLVDAHPLAAHPGRCCAPLRELPSSTIDSLIEAAAQVRMQKKAEHFKRAAIVHGIDEALYQALASALGYKLNKLAFLLLAERAKLRVLREYGAAAESVLFGLAGFLEDPVLNRTPLSKQAYWRGLWEHWWRLRGHFGHHILQRNMWKLAMTRPSNHPHRRLGALAELVRRWKEIRLLQPRLEDVAVWFRTLSHEFWDFHFSLVSAPTERPVRLLGETRINEILANVIYPMLRSSHQGDWEAYKKIRAELGNRRLAIVCRRLFGEMDRAREHIRFLYQQQGLLQIFEDFCMADATNCAGCRFPEIIAKLPR